MCDHHEEDARFLGHVCFRLSENHTFTWTRGTRAAAVQAPGGAAAVAVVAKIQKPVPTMATLTVVVYTSLAGLVNYPLLC